jgi:CDP-glycerol glycerophosphotransferase
VPRISVVVPIYNVEPYLEDCLESLAGQTMDDLEVVMVNDGSTDRSPALAQAFAARDPRFKLVDQPNGGLSRARNTGMDVATGEFLAFVDSDDVVARDAYERLLGALDETGSDFATGNVHRLTSRGTSQARFLTRAFAETRLKTHITRHRDLLADRTAWNKLWRRSFWDRHGLRFPEGRTYEDIPVVLPLHFAARTVDVLADVVYYWRTREGTDLSITQRRAEPRALENRLKAIEEVHDYLAEHGPRKAKQWYDASVVAADLKYFLNVLDSGDDDYRALFLDRVNAFLDGVGRGAFRGLPVIERLKWHLVRRRMLPELLEILRYEREDLRDTPPVRVRGAWYADHPYRTDRRLRIPRRLFRVNKELEFSPGLSAVRWEDGRLRIEGWAFVAGVGAASRTSQDVTLIALPPGRLHRVRLRMTGIRVRADATQLPEPPPGTGAEVSDISWAGFAATLDPRRLRTGGTWRDKRWDLFIAVRVGRVWRRRSVFRIDPARPLRATEHTVPGGAQIAAAPTDAGGLGLRVRTQWATLKEHALEDGTLTLSGEVRASEPERLQLQARRRGDGERRWYPLAIGRGGSFVARVPLAELAAGGDAVWELAVRGGGQGRPLALGTSEAVWRNGGREVALTRALEGDTVLAVRTPRATVRHARWAEDGQLVLEGDVRRQPGSNELVLAGRVSLEQHAFPISDRGDGRGSARLTPARIASLAGDLPLREDEWELHVRSAGDDTARAPVMLADELYDALPVQTVVEHKPFRLGMDPGGEAVLFVGRDLDPDERGRRQQRRLRSTVYAPARGAPLRDAVIYSSFGGRQYSDNPRMIHEELVRRRLPLEHLWVVRDARCRVPDTARVVRANSREHYEALATARYVVDNDHFPTWFQRRSDQTCLQTWHGTPLKQLGFDVSDLRNAVRRFEVEWEHHVRNWQYVLSPNRFSTPILRRAYAIEGEILETGYPRNDVLAAAGREDRSREIRHRLGLPDGARVVLYAPTYRDDLSDSQGRYRLEPALDVELLRSAVGEDTVVLFRKHHYCVDPVPATADGFVRDVSDYPDGTDLMLAADVLVTDYSSMMFDFANTGRPMLFFTYDLDAYRDEIRGFYFDFAAQAPGPLLRTNAELADALRDLDGVAAGHADRYHEFAATFCELDDGHAAARVVDAIFSAAAQHAAQAPTQAARQSADDRSRRSPQR